MSDIDLDRSVATNWREYKDEFRRMKDMVAWVWNELVSREGKAFMRRMNIWMCFLHPDGGVAVDVRLHH